MKLFYKDEANVTYIKDSGIAAIALFIVCMGLLLACSVGVFVNCRAGVYIGLGSFIVSGFWVFLGGMGLTKIDTYG